jgi:hypothetical protein
MFPFDELGDFQALVGRLPRIQHIPATVYGDIMEIHRRFYKLFKPKG